MTLCLPYSTGSTTLIPNKRKQSPPPKKYSLDIFQVSSTVRERRHHQLVSVSVRGNRLAVFSRTRVLYEHGRFKLGLSVWYAYLCTRVQEIRT